MAQAIAQGALVVLLLLAILPGAARSDEIGSETRMECSEGHRFSLEMPQGWTCERRGQNPKTVEVELRPAQRRTPVAIDVALVEGEPRPKIPTEAAAAETVTRVLENRTAMQGPADVQPFEVTHPTLPCTGGAVELSKGEVYAVAVQADAGAGAYFVALFTKTSGKATDEELALFRKTVESLRYAPTK